MSDELPKGWASARLEEIVTKKKGKKPAILRDTPAAGYVPYLDIRAIEKNVVREYAEVKSSKIASKDDLFVVWDGARSGWVGGGITGAIGSTIMALTVQTVESAYVRRFIAGQFQNLNTNTRGTGIPHVDPEVFWNLEVPLAPLAEQRRIVAKLEKLLDQLDACQQRLEKLPTLLKRFRQSVIAAACSGRLTADWREENPTPSSDAENDLPNGWQQTTVGDAIESLKYGTSQKCSHEKQGVPVLRIPNIADGVVSQSDLKYAKLPEKEFQLLRLRVGDILLIRSNGSVSLVGKCALVRAADKDFAYAGYLIRLRPDTKKVLPEFLNLALGSYDIRKQIEIPARSTSGVNNINSEEVRSLEFMLPPLAEQQEIVRRVAGLFALADQLEQRLAQARKQVDKLTPSLLARAFAGKLVPQNPADEPAEKLLERIQQAEK